MSFQILRIRSTLDSDQQPHFPTALPFGMLSQLFFLLPSCSETARSQIFIQGDSQETSGRGGS